ncbi:MAG: glycosyltransferase [Haloquadratum phage sp.]|nr:MAG: glycosyltransferase [Haloquadratum phage sp.]
MTDLSVVIPAYNEAETIEACLTSVTEQETDLDVEIIVCDDGSTDGTRELLAELTHRHPNLVVLRNSYNRGILDTTQRLLRVSQGDAVLRIDADCQLQAESLQSCYQQLQDADILYGRVDVANTDKLHPAACQYGKETGSGTWYGAACVGFSRDILDETDCFQGLRQNLEREVMNRAEQANWSVVKTDEVAVSSEFPVSITEWLPRKFDSGRVYVRECADSPDEFEWRELRGPAFWTCVFASGLAFWLLPVLFAWVYMILQVGPASRVGKIAGKRYVAGLYPYYKVAGGITRTLGVYTELPLLLKTVWRKYA